MFKQKGDPEGMSGHQVSDAFAWLQEQGFTGTRKDVVALLPRARALAEEMRGLASSDANPATVLRNQGIRLPENNGGGTELLLALYLLGVAGAMFGVGRITGLIPPIKDWFRRK